MKKSILCLTLLLSTSIEAFSQPQVHPDDIPNINPDQYRIDQKDIQRAQQLIESPLTTPIAFPNPHPDAQWFPSGSFGLFMHWGIHTVDGIQPSWNMIRHYKYAGKNPHTVKEYYAMADKFNPTKTPDRYLQAAKDAGCTYAVMTTRHHDGYALWPSKYGYGIKQYLPHRDLIKEYVDGCHKANLRVGLYYSPRDWHYPGAKATTFFNDSLRHLVPAITDSAANYREYVKFIGYVMRQLEELLTNYGKIDVLWLDGIDWNGIIENNSEKIYAWIRTLQPGIVINDRWANIVNPDNPDGTSVPVGDFTTPYECRLPSYVPSKWWEHEDLWTTGGGWGYDPKGKFRTLDWLLEHLVYTRSLGGNFLANAGPAPDGDMHPNYYIEIEKLKEWMRYGKESVIDACASPGMHLSNVPLTSRGNDTIYAHVLKKSSNQVSLITARCPKRILLLRTDETIPFVHRDDVLYFKLQKEQRTLTDDVVKIIF